MPKNADALRIATDSPPQSAEPCIRQGCESSERYSYKFTSWQFKGKLYPSTFNDCKISNTGD
jgi:hypothetical protein